MDISQLLGALGAHRYLFAFVLLAAYTRRLTAADSQFPLSVPAAWRPVVTSAVGLVYGVLASVQAGASWRAATLGGVIAAASSGFADMLLVAIFANPQSAPAWARALAFVFDDFKGNANGAGGGSAPPSPSPNGTPPPVPPVPPPPAKKRTFGPIAARPLVVLRNVLRPLDCTARALVPASEVRQ